MKNIAAMSALVAWVALGCGSRGERPGSSGDTEPAVERRADGQRPGPSPGARQPATASTVEGAEPAPNSIVIAAADGVDVHGLLYETSRPERRPIVLLFHQAGSNAGEYAEIAPRLQRLGYHALAIDQRSGGDRWGRANQTVRGRGGATDYLAAYPDLEAAVRWARGQEYPAVVAWGSSYSASLVFKLAAERGDALAAILAFSPGEYMGGRGVVAGWAARVTVPVFVTSAPNVEITAAKAILRRTPSELVVHHEPKRGLHGSSALIESRNPHASELWAPVEAFLARVLD